MSKKKSHITASKKKIIEVQRKRLGDALRKNLKRRKDFAKRNRQLTLTQLSD